MGNHDNALGMLALLKTQYSQTKWEHYADMQQAAVWEHRGEPQKALALYQQSLRNYPDHLYGPHIHLQIDRLQKTIEEQLIQDALQGIAQMESPECRGRSPIVRSTPQDPRQWVQR
jgi:predicted negative regulator of RcsB-dependent stress response